MTKKPVFILGILNVTPDSFSDGGDFLSFDAAIAHAKKLTDEGADYIDIGGDSTRPGSICVGVEEEWARIGKIVSEVAKFTKVSVDTHHFEIARRAIEVGAVMINDVGGGRDLRVVELAKDKDIKIILMHSRCVEPHLFGSERKTIEDVKNFITAKISEAEKLGVPRESLVFDPGLGAFLSDDGEDSVNVLKQIFEFDEIPLCLGISRKGFLKKFCTGDAKDRDVASAFIGALAAGAFTDKPLFIRTHNVELQKEALSFLRSN